MTPIQAPFGTVLDTKFQWKQFFQIHLAPETQTSNPSIFVRTLSGWIVDGCRLNVGRRSVEVEAVLPQSDRRKFQIEGSPSCTWPEEHL